MTSVRLVFRWRWGTCIPMCEGGLTAGLSMVYLQFAEWILALGKLLILLLLEASFNFLTVEWSRDPTQAGVVGCGGSNEFGPCKGASAVLDIAVRPPLPVNYLPLDEPGSLRSNPRCPEPRFRVASKSPLLNLSFCRRLFVKRIQWLSWSCVNFRKAKI